MYPTDYLYSKDHEWVHVEGDQCTIGITHFAQDELGEVVFVDLPDIGRSFDAHEEIGTIESVKAVAEVYTPLGGEIVAVNSGLEDRPEVVNEDPHMPRGL
jgi:glycine cleavage system H protein